MPSVASKRIVIVLLVVLSIVVISYGRSRYTITIGQNTIPAFRDTIPVLQDTIPAVRDSAALSTKFPSTDTITAKSDTLTHPYGIMEIDTVDFWKHIDTLSIPYLDSTYTAYFDSLALHLPDAKDIKRAERRIAREYRDSVRLATPRILDSYVIPDSLHYRRMLTWTHDQDFNDITLTEIDTSFQYRFNDYPFLLNDLNGTYLGTIGSAMQYHNYSNVKSWMCFHNSSHIWAISTHRKICHNTTPNPHIRNLPSGELPSPLSNLRSPVSKY